MPLTSVKSIFYKFEGISQYPLVVRINGLMVLTHILWQILWKIATYKNTFIVNIVLF